MSSKQVSAQAEGSSVFCEFVKPLDSHTAEVEAVRCYFCYDAPCVRACPTQINIPSFIKRISQGNIRGAATEILDANIMGGTCARVCPVEILCQASCVRTKDDDNAVEIGLLQRFATEEFFKTGEQPFKREPSVGKKVAVVGAGPAGLSCAHRLATLGYDVEIFESRAKSGGLNEYGLAPYKVTTESVQKEVDFILKVGGIKIHHGKSLGKDFTLDSLRKDFAAVFLGMGLSGVNALGVAGEELPGVFDAIKTIEKIRQGEKLVIGSDVVVVGGGNTAVDMAIQMKRLGALSVTLAYRRGTEQMGATVHEQELALKSGVHIRTWAKPVKICAEAGKVCCMEFEGTELNSAGKLVGTGKSFTLKANQIYKAIGQTLLPSTWGDPKTLPEVANGKIKVNAEFETSLAGVYAGGDCIAEGEDLTVTSVQQGKLAALAIHKKGDPRRG